MTTESGVSGRSFKPWLLVILAMVVGGSFLNSLGQRWGIFLVAAAGCIPFLLQLCTGHALDASWVARHSRIENPRRYWFQLIGALLLALCLGFGAYQVFASAS